MKIAALDVGDVWTGIALSDPMGILAKPYETVKTVLLETFLHDLIKKEKVNTIVVGHPRTLRGTSSEQTKKVEETFKHLQLIFPDITFLLWDERLTSKQAEALKKPFTPEEKRKSHAVAAAFILQGYLQAKAFQQEDF